MVFPVGSPRQENAAVNRPITKQEKIEAAKKFVNLHAKVRTVSSMRVAPASTQVVVNNCYGEEVSWFSLVSRAIRWLFNR